MDQRNSDSNLPTSEQRETLRRLLSNYQAGPELIVPHGTLPQELRTEVLSADHVKLLLAGQRGMGKTTELRRLVTLLEGSEVIPIFVQFGAQHTISLPLLIRAMAVELFEHPDTEVPAKKRHRFLDWFSDEQETIVSEEGSFGSAAIGGKIPVLKGERGVRHKKATEKKKTIKAEKPLRELIDSFNDAILAVREETNRRPVFIVDDIDKIQDPYSVETTFINDSHIVDTISASCVFTVPITYATSSSIRLATLPYGGFYRVPAIPLFNKARKRNEDAFAFMRNVLQLRMPFNPIPDEPLDLILGNCSRVWRNERR